MLVPPVGMLLHRDRSSLLHHGSHLKELDPRPSHYGCSLYVHIGLAILRD